MTNAMSLPQHSVVVGVDGSPSARAALRWAVANRREDQTVFAVSAWHVPADGNRSGQISLDEDVRADQRQTFELTLAGALGADWKAVVVPELLYGNPGHILGDLSAEAEAIVVGSHGHHAPLTGPLGSVSAYLVTHATCPVTVVPATDEEA